MNVGDYQSEISKYMRFAPKKREDEPDGPTGTALDPFLQNSSDLSTKGRSYASQHSGGYGGGGGFEGGIGSPDEPAEAPPEEQVEEVAPPVAAVDTPTKANPEAARDESYLSADLQKSMNVDMGPAVQEPARPANDPWMTPEMRAAGKLEAIDVDERKFLSDKMPPAVPKTDDEDPSELDLLYKKHGVADKDKAYNDYNPDSLKAFWNPFLDGPGRAHKKERLGRDAREARSRAESEYRLRLEAKNRKYAQNAANQDSVVAQTPTLEGGKQGTMVHYRSGASKFLEAPRQQSAKDDQYFAPTVDDEGYYVRHPVDPTQPVVRETKDVQAEGPSLPGARSPIASAWVKAPPLYGNAGPNTTVYDKRTGDTEFTTPPAPSKPTGQVAPAYIARLKDAAVRARTEANAAATSGVTDQKTKDALERAAQAAEDVYQQYAQGSTAPSQGGAPPPPTATGVTKSGAKYALLD